MIVHKSWPEGYKVKPPSPKSVIMDHIKNSGGMEAELSFTGHKHSVAVVLYHPKKANASNTNDARCKALVGLTLASPALLLISRLPVGLAKQSLGFQLKAMGHQLLQRSAQTSISSSECLFGLSGF